MGRKEETDHPGFFEVDERLVLLGSLGDQFEAFVCALDFGQFRPDLEKALACSDWSKGGLSLEERCHP